MTDKKLLELAAKAAGIDVVLDDHYDTSWAHKRLAPNAPQMRKATRDEKIASPGVYEVPCTAHPDAPHGFNRDSSHTLGRYVCDCEVWVPDNAEITGLSG